MREREMYGLNSDFDRAFDDLRVAILNFKLSSFINKDIVPPKTQHIFPSFLFNKSV